MRVAAPLFTIIYLLFVAELAAGNVNVIGEVTYHTSAVLSNVVLLVIVFMVVANAPFTSRELAGAFVPMPTFPAPVSVTNAYLFVVVPVLTEGAATYIPKALVNVPAALSTLNSPP